MMKRYNRFAEERAERKVAMHIKLLGAALGLVATLLLGFGVKRAIGTVKVEVPSPNGVDPKEWNSAMQPMGVETGMWLLGVLEQIIYFISLWVGAYLVIGGWLAFKLASKWQVWQHIVKFPIDKVPSIKPLEIFRVSNALGSRLLSKFLI